MSTDEEAFIHNTCKKVAQLVRVVTEFNDVHIEMARKNKLAAKNFEKTISTVVEKNQVKLDVLHDSLIQYRKGQIEEACKDYGMEYRQIKSDYADLLNERSVELNSISREAKQISRSMKELTRNSILQAKDILNSADSFEKDVKNYKRSGSSVYSPEAREEIHRLHLLSNEEKERYQRVVKKMKSEHNKITSRLEKEIRALLKQEILNRLEHFAALKQSICTIKEDIPPLKTQYMDLKKESKIMLHDFKAQRTEILASTTTTVKNIDKNIKIVRDAIKNEIKCYASELTELKKRLSTSRSKQKHVVDELLLLLQKQRDDITVLEATIAKRRSEKLSELSEEEAALLKVHKTEIQMRMEEIKIQRAILDERAKQTEYLNNKSVELKRKFLGELEMSKDKFESNRRKQEFDFERLMKEEEDRYQQANEEQFSLTKAAFDCISDGSRHTRKMQRKEIHKIKKNVAAILIGNDDQLKSKEKEKVESCEERKQIYQKEEDNVSVQYNERIERHKDKLNSKLQDVKNNFRADEERLAQKIDKENEKILGEKKDNSYSLEKETSEFKREKGLLQDKLEFVIKQSDVNRNIIEKLQNETAATIAAMDKNKRQHERQHKASVDAMINEYEMTIQFEQVQLSDKIDHIAELYDKDENQRGVEVIEAIRKVKQMQNRTRDLSASIQKKHQEKMKMLEEEKNDILMKIENLRNGKEVDELTEKLAGLEKMHQENVTEYKEATDRICEQRKNDINVAHQYYEEIKDRSQKYYDANLMEWREQEAHLQESIEKVRNEIKEHKQEVGDVVDEEIEESKRNHSISVNSLQKRIQSAKERLKEATDDSDTKVRTEKEKNAEDLELRTRNLQKMWQDTEGRNQEDLLVDKVGHLNQRLSQMDIDSMSFPMRPIEASLIRENKSQLKKLMEQIKDVYLELIGVKMKSTKRPVQYRSIAINTEPIEPIPRSALYGDFQPQRPTTTETHRSRPSIVRPHTARDRD